MLRARPNLTFSKGVLSEGSRWSRPSGLDGVRLKTSSALFWRLGIGREGPPSDELDSSISLALFTIYDSSSATIS